MQMIKENENKAQLTQNLSENDPINYQIKVICLNMFFKKIQSLNSKLSQFSNRNFHFKCSMDVKIMLEGVLINNFKKKVPKRLNG